MTTVVCPHCQARTRLTDNTPGRNIKCPNCGIPFRPQPAPADVPSSPLGLDAVEESEFTRKLVSEHQQKQASRAVTAAPEPAPPAPAAPPQTSTLTDYLLFRKMIAPVVLQVIFWLGVLGCVSAGLVQVLVGLLSRGESPGPGLLTVAGLLCMIVGPLLLRLACEVLLVFFHMHQTLTEIQEDLAHR